MSVRNELADMIKKLCADGVIEPVNASEWISPIVLVKKRNGELRMCTDLRSVNKQIVMECHPLPKVQDLLAKLDGAKIFTTIDLKSAYHQVELTEDSRDVTTFITPEGTLRYIRMPFGLSSAASVFQRLMNCLFGDTDGVVAFQDDILIFSDTVEKHHEILDKDLSVLEDKGMTIRLDKCKFFSSNVEYLGHQINGNGIFPKKDLLLSIKNMNNPQDKDQLKSFLGLCEYYSRFVPKFADIVFPLRLLLKKGCKFSWTNEHSQAVSAIKSAIVGCNPLSPFSPNAANVITVDASAIGLGAVFSQIKANNEVTIAFASRPLSADESKYSTIEREALGCSWAVDHFKTYLWGKPFKLKTDHKPLISLLSNNGVGRASSRLVRILAKLYEYNFEVIYIPGSQNMRADCLSRLLSDTQVSIHPDCLEECVVASVDDMVLSMSQVISKEEWSKALALDEELELVQNYIRDVWPLERNLSKELAVFWKVREELSTNKNLILKGDFFVPPKIVRQKIMSIAHLGHLGQSSTIKNS